MAVPAAVAPAAPPLLSVPLQSSSVPNLDPTNPNVNVLSTESRNALVDKYRYDDNVKASTIERDLLWLNTEWEKRVNRAISDEADRTNNWSLLWKAEAMYESLDDKITKLLLSILRSVDDRANFSMFVDGVCDFKNYPDNKYLWPEDREEKRCTLFQSEMEGAIDKHRIGEPFITPPAKLAEFKSRAGGTDAQNRQVVQWWNYRRDVQQQANRMFAQLRSWTKCEGRLRLPEKRAPIEGFNHLSSRIVEWLIWPYMSPAVFPTQRQVMVFGPAGAGKTIISQLAAFDIAKALVWADVKRLPLANRARASDAANVNDYITVYFVDALKFRSPNAVTVGERLKNYLSCLQYEITRDKTRLKRRKLGLMILDNLDTLFVTDDELRRQPRAERKSTQLKSWIYKASPEVVAKFGGQNNTPFATSLPAETSTNTSREGGQGTITTTTVTTSSTGGHNVTEVIASILSPAALEAEYPDVRVIWSVRYPWKLPPLLHSYVKRRQLFVDLPSSRARRSYLEGLLRDDLSTNLADRIIEEQKLEAQRSEVQRLVVRTQADNVKIAQIDSLLNDSDRKASEPDQTAYNLEQALKNGVATVNGVLGTLKTEYLRQYNDWNRYPVKPTPGNLMNSVIYNNPTWTALANDYVKDRSSVLDQITTASGMSLEGYCKLQSEYGLSVTEVDAYLVTTGKKRDGYAGSTPFGYTLEDLKNFYQFMKGFVNQRLLKQAFELKQAFIYGSTRFASTGCKDTAANIERNNGEIGLNANSSLINWTPTDGEKTTCKVALGWDLTDLKTGVPVLPLWARFGSHRILKMDDAVRAINTFERYVTPKPDYPEFVIYAMYGTPKLNRPLLGPGHTSQICRARPGPASTFLFPPTNAPSGLMAAHNARINGTLAPWSVLFAPSPRLGGGGPQPQFPDLSFRGQYRALSNRHGGAVKKRIKRSKNHLSSDYDHLLIDEVFQRQ